MARGHKFSLLASPHPLSCNFHFRISLHRIFSTPGNRRGNIWSQTSSQKKSGKKKEIFTAFNLEALLPLIFLPRTKNVNAAVVSWLIEPLNGGKNLTSLLLLIFKSFKNRQNSLIATISWRQFCPRIERSSFCW